MAYATGTALASTWRAVSGEKRRALKLSGNLRQIIDFLSFIIIIVLLCFQMAKG